MKRIYLSLGSNMGDRLAALECARGLLAAHGVVILRESSIYESEPQDFHAQPWFLNQVIEAETALLPMQLVGRTQRIELEMGRRRTVKKGPRMIDIDILLYHKFVIETERLTVPHPRMAQRRFVLAPLVELAPDLRHPMTRQTMRELLGQLQGQMVRRFSSAS